MCLFAAQVSVRACFSVGSLQFCCLSAPLLDSTPLHGFVSLPVLQQLVSFSPRFALRRQLWSQGLCLRTPVHVNNMQHNSASYRSVHRKSYFQYYLVCYTNLSTDAGPSFGADQHRPREPGFSRDLAPEGCLSFAFAFLCSLLVVRPLSW